MRELSQEEIGECNGGFLCIALGAFAAFTVLKVFSSFTRSFCAPPAPVCAPPAPAPANNCPPAPTAPVDQQRPVPEPLF